MGWDTLAHLGPVTDGGDHLQARPSPPDPTIIAQAVDLLKNAKSPMIMVGSGAQHAGREMRELAEMLDAPVTAFRGGRGMVPGDGGFMFAASE